MLHTVGDYYSTIPAPFAIWVSVILIVILLVVILVQARHAKVLRDRQRRLAAKYSAPTKPRSTFVAAEAMRFTGTQERHIAALTHQKEDTN